MGGDWAPTDGAGNLSDSESAETALVFASKVVKKAGTAEEIAELSRLARKCPDILPRAMLVVDRCNRRVTRSQIKCDKMKEVVAQKDEELRSMEGRYNSVNTELIEMKKAGDKISTIVSLERQLGDKVSTISSLERQVAEAERREKEQTRVYDRKIGNARIKVSDLARKVNDKDYTISSLERQLAEARLEAKKASDLRAELATKEELLKHYAAHSKRMRVLFGQRTVVRAQGMVCPREVEEKLAEIAATKQSDDPTDMCMVEEERRVVYVDREATTEEDSD